MNPINVRDAMKDYLVAQLPTPQVDVDQLTNVWIDDAALTEQFISVNGVAVTLTSGAPNLNVQKKHSDELLRMLWAQGKTESALVTHVTKVIARTAKTATWTSDAILIAGPRRKIAFSMKIEGAGLATDATVTPSVTMCDTLSGSYVAAPGVTFSPASCAKDKTQIYTGIIDCGGTAQVQWVKFDTTLSTTGTYHVQVFYQFIYNDSVFCTLDDSPIAGSSFTGKDSQGLTDMASNFGSFIAANNLCTLETSVDGTTWVTATSTLPLQSIITGSASFTVPNVNTSAFYIRLSVNNHPEQTILLGPATITAV